MRCASALRKGSLESKNRVKNDKKLQEILILQLFLLTANFYY